MKPLGFLKHNLQLFGFFTFLGLTLVSGILYLYKLDIPWFEVVDNIGIYLLLFVLIFDQKEELERSNIDNLSLFLLLLFPPFSFYSGISSIVRDLIYFSIFVIGITGYVIVKRNKNTKIAKFSIKQIIHFLLGLTIGLGIALVKIYMNHSVLVDLAKLNPSKYIFSLFLSLTTNNEEFIFRGLLWGYLRKLGIKDGWIIIFSSVLWTLIHVNSYNNFPELINLMINGIVFGWLVKKTKSIVSSVGAHAGYNSFLIMQKIFFP
jgi:membrane protease YdiL (CAAX protease family)